LGQQIDVQTEKKSEDPVEALRKLKQLLEEGLISEDQFNKKRDQILEQM